MSENSIPKKPVLIKRVTPEEMCKRFNEGKYWEKVIAGEWESHVLAEHLSTLLPTEPGRIRSQLVSYRRKSDGLEMARAHQFLRDDGSVAASGKPDPKRMYDPAEDVLYRLQKKQKI